MRFVVGVMNWFRCLLGLLCTLVVYAEAQNSSALLQAALQQLPKCAASTLNVRARPLLIESGQMLGVLRVSVGVRAD